MRLAYGEGVVIAILAPVVVYLIGIIDLTQLLFFTFALFGVWTMVSAFLLVSERERLYYFEWGLVIAAVSTALVIPLAYATALVLVAVIGVIVYSAFQRKRTQPASGHSNSSQ